MRFVRLTSDLNKQFHQLSTRALPAVARRTAAGDHNEINTGKPLLAQPKSLAYEPLYPVTVDRPGSNLLADNYADSRPVQCVCPRKHAEMATDRDRLPGERSQELDPPQQTRRTWQCRRTRGAQTLNRARPLARRARSTLRPPRVRIRTRNPWVRLRRVFEG